MTMQHLIHDSLIVTTGSGKHSLLAFTRNQRSIDGESQKSEIQIAGQQRPGMLCIWRGLTLWLDCLRSSRGKNSRKAQKVDGLLYIGVQSGFTDFSYMDQSLYIYQEIQDPHALQ